MEKNDLCLFSMPRGVGMRGEEGRTWQGACTWLWGAQWWGLCMPSHVSLPSHSHAGTVVEHEVVRSLMPLRKFRSPLVHRVSAPGSLGANWEEEGKAGRDACFCPPAEIMNQRRQEKLGPPEGQPAALSTSPRAWAAVGKLSAWLQLDFLTDGQFNEPIYRGSFNMAITPINLFVAGLQ